MVPVTAASGADQPTLRDQFAATLEALADLSRGSERYYEARRLVTQAQQQAEADRERAKAEGGADRLTDDELADEVVRRRLTLGAIDRAAIRAVDRAAALRAET